MARPKRGDSRLKTLPDQEPLFPPVAIAAITLPTVAAVDLPFETEWLRKGIAAFIDQKISFEGLNTLTLGAVKWGAYAFYDYDGEPIYVGQTKERLGTRIRRHLTNQRTDAVAMHVLDPFEVHSIEVWPLIEFQATNAKSPHYAQAVTHLNALEHSVYTSVVAKSEFKIVLNEKDPVRPVVEIELPASFKGVIVSAEVSRLRDHPDLRIARRAATLAKLAQVIGERKVQRGLRRTLLAQAKRLASLAQKRYDSASEVQLEEGDEVESGAD